MALIGPNGSGKTTLLETLLGKREPGAGRPARSRRRGRVLLAAGGGARRARLGAPVRADDDGAAAAAGAVAAREVPLLGLGRAREGGEGALGRRAAPARARDRRRLRRELPRARRADEPPRPREPRGARGGARGVPRHRAARLARSRAARRGRRADARDRARPHQLATTAAGPTTCAIRDDRAAQAAPPKPAKPKPHVKRELPERKRSTRPTELDLVEDEIATLETTVAELERQLSEDWANVDVLAAAPAARDDLQALLSRWEALFERSQA